MGPDGDGDLEDFGLLTRSLGRKGSLAGGAGPKGRIIDRDRGREIGVTGASRTFASGLLTFFSLGPLFGLLLEANEAVDLGRRRRSLRLREGGQIRGRKETLFGLLSEELLSEELDFSFELRNLLSKERDGLLGELVIAKGSMGAEKTGRKCLPGSSVRRRRLQRTRGRERGRKQESVHAPCCSKPKLGCSAP